jgi:integrase/recombinase XerD
MKSPVQLYLRVRLPDGTYPYLKAAFTSHGRIRPHHAIYRGRAVHFPDSSYQLRYRIGAKRVWEVIGSDESLALDAVREKTRQLQDNNESSSIAVTNPTATTPATEPETVKAQEKPLLLNDAIAAYLTETEKHKSKKTYAAYRTTLYLFSPGAAEATLAKLGADENSVALKVTLERMIERAATTGRRIGNKPISHINRKDILSYIEYLKGIGNEPRTVRNRVDFLQIFLHHFGLPSLLKGKDLPPYTEKKARAYNPGQIAKLFAKATQDEADLLHFFLCTGAREQEAQFVCWPDVDLELKTYTVTEHLDLGYKPKDKEEGSLPIPDVLVNVLKARRVRHSKTRLIFPGKGGKPNGHALRIIKRLALRAGVNCGQCRTKAGKSCAAHPVCRQFVLHKLRKTFATTLHHKGLPAQTLQRYLRHSDLDTTLKYIADADDDTIRRTINSTFNGLGGAQ